MPQAAYWGFSVLWVNSAYCLIHSPLATSVYEGCGGTVKVSAKKIRPRWSTPEGLPWSEAVRGGDFFRRTCERNEVE